MKDSRRTGVGPEPDPIIYVCPLAQVAETALRVGAGHLVTLISAEHHPATPAGVPRHRHLRLAIDDITLAMPGFTAPDTQHVASLLAFAEAWDRKQPMLIHCHAGVSRSTAAAFAVMCALHDRGSEAAIARALRAAAPWAEPNFRIVELADDLLTRDGALIRAIEELGSGDISAMPRPFGLAGPFLC